MDNTMVNNLPIVARNPFTLALLNPAVVSRYTAQKNPFFMWAASTVEVGGSQNRTNDVLVDGMPVMLGPKSSYAPTMDNTTEVTVQQNSVDAEYGHSSGGDPERIDEVGDQRSARHRLLLRPQSRSSTPSRTRSPARPIWCAITSGAAPSGNAMKKNRIFNFFAYEQWRQRDPQYRPAAHDDPAGGAGRLLAVAQHQRRAAHDLRSMDLQASEGSAATRAAIRRKPDSAVAHRSVRAEVPGRDVGAEPAGHRTSPDANNFAASYHAQYRLSQHQQPHRFQPHRQSCGRSSASAGSARHWKT